MSQIADKIYRNAKIYSVALNGTETHADSLAIKDGKFVYFATASKLNLPILFFLK